MSISIEWLAQLPMEEQERILTRLSLLDDDLAPIEINGTVYHIPHEVLGLIDSLWAQLGNNTPYPD